MTQIDEVVFDIHAPLNQERKFNHEECGDRRQRLYVRRTEKGWVYTCFNCGAKGFERASCISVLRHQQICRQPNNESQVSEESFRLPRQATMSKEARDWLNKYGITEEEEERYGIYYTNEFGGKVVLPVLKSELSICGDVISGYQLRRIQGAGPKYITQKRDKEKPLRFLSIGQGMLKGQDRRCNDLRLLQICVVEDILSAIIVGRQCQALSLLGSPGELPCDVCDFLQSRGGNIGFWLDSDKYFGSLRYAQRYISLYGNRESGQKVAAIRTEKDPKCYDDEEISQILERSLQ